MSYDIIHVSGKPHVLIPLHDYTALKSGSRKDDLPADILQALALGKENPLKTLRRFRGLTQEDLAGAAGISRPYLTEIETGRKDGSIRAMKSLAQALDVPLDLLTV